MATASPTKRKTAPSPVAAPEPEFDDPFADDEEQMVLQPQHPLQFDIAKSGNNSNGNGHTNGNGHMPAVPLPVISVPELPAEQLSGIEEFGPQRNWMSFDAPRGVLVCKNLDMEYTEIVGIIKESRVVRVMKDSDGKVFCASSNREVADTGRVGRMCATCPDRDVDCAKRWWIGWIEIESDLIFAHTLSLMGTLNFNRYVLRLGRYRFLPSQVTTRIFIEEAKRTKTNATYRRVQFERVG